MRDAEAAKKRKERLEAAEAEEEAQKTKMAKDLAAAKRKVISYLKLQYGLRFIIFVNLKKYFTNFSSSLFHTLSSGELKTSEIKF